MPDTMKAWVYDRRKEDKTGVYIFLRDMPIPHPNTHDVLLKVIGVSVCGTDETLFIGKHGDVPCGIIPGHEFFGEVVEIGKGVQDIRIGQLVVGESHYTEQGYKGEGIIGFRGPMNKNGHYIPPINGAYAEYLCIPDCCVRKIPLKVIQDGFWTSLFEGVGNDYKIGTFLQEKHLLGTIGIVGCGPHGLYTQIFGKHFGVERLVAFEVNHYRRGFARGLDVADYVINPTHPYCDEQIKEITNGRLFDVIIDIAGQRQNVLDFCIRYTHNEGTVILFGLYDDPLIKLGGYMPNDIIFNNRALKVSFDDKNLFFQGITGREGIWDRMIQEVTNNRVLQRQIMALVSIMGPLDKLGEDTRNPDPEVLKRAYHNFE